MTRWAKRPNGRPRRPCSWRIAQWVEWIYTVDDLLPMQNHGIIRMRVKVTVLKGLHVRMHLIPDIGDGHDGTGQTEKPVIRILGMCKIWIPDLINVQPELAHMTAWSLANPAFPFILQLLSPLSLCRSLWAPDQF